MSNSDILAIILAVIGATALPAWKFTERAFKLRLASWVWPVASEENQAPVIHLRASLDELAFGENPPSIRGYTHSCDVQSILNIYRFFERLPVRLQFEYYPLIHEFMKNVVVIGGSSRSDVSREISKELYYRGSKVHGVGKHAFYQLQSGETLHCSHAIVDGKPIVTKDAGVIYRSVSESGSTILMCAGLHTYGSLAATEVALSIDFQKRVRARKFRQFLQFVTVDVIASGHGAGLGIVHQSIRWREYPIEEITSYGPAE